MPAAVTAIRLLFPSVIEGTTIAQFETCEPGAPTKPIVLVAPRAGEPVLDVRVRLEDHDHPADRIVGVADDGEAWFEGRFDPREGGEQQVSVQSIAKAQVDTLTHGRVRWHLGDNTKLQETSEVFLLPEQVLTLFPRGVPREVLDEVSRAQQSGEARTTRASVADLTQQVFMQNPPRYDRNSGAPHYVTINSAWDSLTFHQKRYEDARKNLKSLINCYDCAAYLQVLLRVAGYKVRYAYLRPFGYLRETPLIGHGRCNNPFVTHDAALVLSTSSAKRTAFGNHAFCEVEVSGQKRIADGCAGPHAATEDRIAYVASATDDKTPPNPAVPRGKASDIMDYIGVDKVQTLVRMGAELSGFMEEAETGVTRGTVLDEPAEAFAQAVGYGGVPDEGGGVVRVPDPRECPELADYTLAFNETAVGYPETNRYWRFEGKQGAVLLSVYASSAGVARAHQRFLTLGAVYEAPEPPYRPGPGGLGEARAELASEAGGRLLWVRGHLVFDLTSSSGVDPLPIARWLDEAAQLQADARPSVLEPSADREARVGGVVVVEVPGFNPELVDFAVGEPNLVFLEQTYGQLRFVARRSGATSIAITVADATTLLAAQTTITVNIAP